jgi:hypothetical protein
VSYVASTDAVGGVRELITFQDAGASFAVVARAAAGYVEKFDAQA